MSSSKSLRSSENPGGGTLSMPIRRAAYSSGWSTNVRQGHAVASHSEGQDNETTSYEPLEASLRSLMKLESENSHYEHKSLPLPNDEVKGFATYRKQISAVQAQMGLERDGRNVPTSQTVAAAARKLALASSRPLDLGNPVDRKGQAQVSLRLERAAWWVRDAVPITPDHKRLLEPVADLIEIRCAEIRRREAIFRQRNGSVVTLPDFSIVLEQEEAEEEHGKPAA
ncbi:hypothetical protein BKA70DRAFT_1436184 [Coprinopsis sp. MPI-PUGE-AT-0042]|nr:hypothetical protein BKA70DRAFT_1436184 [Coprinopsis sp. MPI-PUGE-AT-0042]